MRRRDFIAAVGGAAVAGPLAARAQRPQSTRRIGVLMGLAEGDVATVRGREALQDGLSALGWLPSRNIDFVYRYADGDPERARMFAKELIDQGPVLIVAHTTPVVAALQKTTTGIPVVFVSITDPVAGGFVETLARPGKNITGFTNYDFSMGGKWLEILKGIAPATTRVLLVLNPDWGSYYTEYLGSIEAAALSFAVQTTLAPVHNADEIEQAIRALSREPGGALIVLPSAPITAHSDVIVQAAARHKIPAVYPFRRFVTNGGLAFYGTDLSDLFRRSASYVDQILKGAAASDLPVQQPSKFEMAINMKTAKALGLTVPPALLARADEVIE